MATLANATSLRELKALYRRYASIHHPDKGGNPLTMQKINRQYEAMKIKLKQDQHSNVYHIDFSDITVGSRLFINNTQAEVIAVDEHYFRVVAIGRNRQAQFDKKTGLGRFNQKLRASFQPLYQQAC